MSYAKGRPPYPMHARKQKEGGFSVSVLRKVVEDFNKDWESYFLIEVTDGLVRFVGDIPEKYLLRGFDSIHLASAVNLKNKINADIYFSSHDTRLNQAAEKEGISVIS